MKKTFFYIIACAVFATSSFAYTVTNKPIIICTGYKMTRKIAVHGEFKDFDFRSTSSDKLENFLLSMNAKINAMSLNTKMTMRDNAITQTLFRLSSSQTLEGKIISVRGDDKSGTLSLDTTMNGVQKIIKMKYVVEGDTIKMSGKTDVLDYNMRSQFEAFKKRCRGFHGGKSWSEIRLDIEIHFMH